MLVSGSNVEEFSQALARASATATKVEAFDLSALNKVLEYHPEDMTVTVQTGATLGSLQRELSSHGQWLAIDPPQPEKVTIDHVINLNLSGPRRYGFGTIREHLIGLKAVLADGRVIQNGGKVVKNVAGFDLCKLFVGSRWSLGVVVEATFRLHPLPAEELFLGHSFATAMAAAAAVQQILESDLTPVVLDLHSSNLPQCSAVLGFAGTTEVVTWQRKKAEAFGFSTSIDLGHEVRFWGNNEPAQRSSVLPSQIGREIEARTPREFVARAGNGMMFYRGGSAPQTSMPASALNQKLKQTFDPGMILPPLPQI
jgi:FAD/FMN-containing dehydrogenase